MRDFETENYIVDGGQAHIKGTTYSFIIHRGYLSDQIELGSDADDALGFFRQWYETYWMLPWDQCTAKLDVLQGERMVVLRQRQALELKDDLRSELNLPNDEEVPTPKKRRM